MQREGVGWESMASNKAESIQGFQYGYSCRAIIDLYSTQNSQTVYGPGS